MHPAGLFPSLHQKEFDTELADRLAKSLGVTRAIAEVLCARGITTFDQARDFFNPDLEKLENPFVLPGMNAATVLVKKHLAAGSAIGVFGDFDVDGLTATAFTKKILLELGAPEVHTEIPSRLTDGYGLNRIGLDRLKEKGCALILTVDCATTATEEIAYAKTLGLDILVTDHHQPPQTLPAPDVLLNPQLGESDSLKSLAGVGVALKLAQALCLEMGHEPAVWQNLLWLVALGTVADIVPLTGENRILVWHGIEQLKKRPSAGIAKLMDEQGIDAAQLSSGKVGFQLAPPLNAIGRLGDSAVGLELLLTDDLIHASQLAASLVRANTKRKSIQKSVEQEVREMLEKQEGSSAQSAIVLADARWHRGVVGIVASRIAERFYRPVLLGVVDEDGVVHGSGRSIPEVDILDALRSCADLFLTFGGHSHAAGFSLRADNLSVLQTRFSQAVDEQLKGVTVSAKIACDANVALGECDAKMLRIFKRMEPFGRGNPRPVLRLNKTQLAENVRVVGSQHLKMRLSQHGKTIEAIGFQMAELQNRLQNSEHFSVAASLEENIWNGKWSLQLQLKGVEV